MDHTALQSLTNRDLGFKEIGRKRLFNGRKGGPVGLGERHADAHAAGAAIGNFDTCPG